MIPPIANSFASYVPDEYCFLGPKADGEDSLPLTLIDFKAVNISLNDIFELIL